MNIYVFIKNSRAYVREKTSVQGIYRVKNRDQGIQELLHFTAHAQILQIRK